jgi:hypothetical protein
MASELTATRPAAQTPFVARIDMLGCFLGALRRHLRGIGERQEIPRPAEIEYRAKSGAGKVRHPFFKGIREDL